MPSTVLKNAKQELNVNLARVAERGSSSGGDFAAILALKAAEFALPIPITFQLLLIPVTDNTASVETSWKSNMQSPWLSAAQMEWFDGFYLSNKDWARWDVSQLSAPEALVARPPPAWI